MRFLRGRKRLYLLDFPSVLTAPAALPRRLRVRLVQPGRGAGQTSLSCFQETLFVQWKQWLDIYFKCPVNVDIFPRLS